MRVATFGPSTGWAGRGIDHDGRRFILEGHGPISPQAVLDYDRLGQIAWAHEGLRDWTRAVAAQGGVPAGSGAWSEGPGGGAPTGAGGWPGGPGAGAGPAARAPARRSRFPVWAIALIVAALIAAALAAALILPRLSSHTDQAHKSLVQTGPGGGRPGHFTVTLRSDAGDYIGGGQTYRYTEKNATLSLETTGNHLTVNVTPATMSYGGWDGEFQEPAALRRLEPGIYGGVARYGFHDPKMGGMEWMGDGRGSNTISGWFAVDKVTYDGDALSLLVLRFEQHSDGVAPALRGKIEWSR